MSARTRGSATALRWEFDRRGRSAFARHEGYDLAVLRDQSSWLWLVYHADDDCSDGDTIAKGRERTRHAAIEQAQAAVVRAVMEDRRLSSELWEDGLARTSYRVFLRDRMRQIVGRHDFDAADDRAAITIAELLLDACSDMSAQLDLWQGARCVGTGDSFSRPGVSATEITARMQEALIRAEEAIQQSDWAIARSQRLLERARALANESWPARLAWAGRKRGR